MALNVIRALRDTLLICACRLFQLGNPFKARIEQWKRLAVEQESIKNTPTRDVENDAKRAKETLPEGA